MTNQEVRHFVEQNFHCKARKGKFLTELRSKFNEALADPVFSNSIQRSMVCKYIIEHPGCWTDEIINVTLCGNVSQVVRKTSAALYSAGIIIQAGHQPGPFPRHNLHKCSGHHWNAFLVSQVDELMEWQDVEGHQ